MSLKLEKRKSHVDSIAMAFIKASELVTGSLLPHWNLMRFFARGSLSEMSSLQEVRFATLYGKVQACHEYCNLYVTMLRFNHIRAGTVKFPKSWLWTLLCWQKIHHFFFSHTWDTHLKYLPKLCPYILMYSALHIMQWVSQILDVFTPKIRENFFWFLHFMNQNKCCLNTKLEVIPRTKYFTTITVSNWFVTLYYKLLPAVSLPSKHGRWWSSLLLYSISMVFMPWWYYQLRGILPDVE